MTTQKIDVEQVGIEPATHGDIPALLRLLAQLFSIEQDFTPDRERQRRGLEMLLAEPRAGVFVARAMDGVAVGMASAQLVVSTAEGAASVWIEDVVVSPEMRGCGVGRALLAAVLEWAHARGATRAQLLTDLDNSPALAFYQRLGWQPTRLGAWRRSIDAP